MSLWFRTMAALSSADRIRVVAFTTPRCSSSFASFARCLGVACNPPYRVAPPSIKLAHVPRCDFALGNPKVYCSSTASACCSKVTPLTFSIT